MKKCIVWGSISICVLCIVCGIISSFELFIPRAKKSEIYITSTYVPMTYEELLEKSDLILRGKAVQKVSEKMTNPDGKGEVANWLVTEFEVEITELYKGTYDGDTISVKFSCGHGLNPDLILYGEDKKSILDDKVELPDMPVGEECLLFLSYDSFEKHPAWTHGFYPTVGYGYLKPDGKGSFIYEGTAGQSTIVAKAENIKEDLSALKK